MGMTLVGFLAGSAWAAESGNSIYAGAGYAKPKDLESGATYFTGGLEFGLAGGVGLQAEFGYWKKSEGLEEFLQVGVDDKMVGLNLIVRPETKGSVGVFLGAGAAVHMVKLSASVLGISDSDTKTVVGGQALGGIDLKVSDDFGLFATVRYEVNGKPDWGGAIGQPDISGFKAYGGIRVHF